MKKYIEANSGTDSGEYDLDALDAIIETAIDGVLDALPKKYPGMEVDYTQGSQYDDYINKFWVDYNGEADQVAISDDAFSDSRTIGDIVSLIIRRVEDKFGL